eukprot:TRINITY_DN12964_c0_g1_i4.p1 TRINITY_DN12964_c0_g1~~TRINITY_DN12964_c0_g1_i4.p1  ORF type:complete len:201 (-),score=37.50 TRINITY_DN12964_c0_g1_i4:100-702(-)
MAVDILAMQEILRWEGVDAEAHLAELLKFDEFNSYISEYFDTPQPAQNVLDALAILMGWSGDAKQIVTKITGQRHTEDKTFPEKIKQFQSALKETKLSKLSEANQHSFSEKLREGVEWQKFDDEAQRYNERTPMNSYDVLKCSQACFHLFEWLRSLLPEKDRPPRYVEIDIKAFRLKEEEMKGSGSWPQAPPPGPTERTF